MKYLRHTIRAIIISALALIIFNWLLDVTEGKEYTNTEICKAIYIIEGKDKARQPFGIETIECKTYEKCQQICINTVRNNKERFKKQNKEKDFYIFLGKRYCPYNWKIWVKNLKFYLRKCK